MWPIHLEYCLPNFVRIDKNILAYFFLRHGVNFLSVPRCKHHTCVIGTGARRCGASIRRRQLRSQSAAVDTDAVQLQQHAWSIKPQPAGAGPVCYHSVHVPSQRADQVPATRLHRDCCSVAVSSYIQLYSSSHNQIIKTNKQVEIINIYATITTGVQKSNVHNLYFLAKKTITSF